jgi:hypothetical protein
MSDEISTLAVSRRRAVETLFAPHAPALATLHLQPPRRIVGARSGAPSDDIIITLSTQEVCDGIGRK